MGEDAETELIAEQLKHTIALLRAEIAQLRQIQEHDREMGGHRLRALEERRGTTIRIRTATDRVTQFKMWSGPASGGSAGVMATAPRAWLGVTCARSGVLARIWIRI
jgi:hypothetical protein